MGDVLIDMELVLPQGETEQLVRVMRRSLNEKGPHIGQYNDNPVLNTAIYDVKFPDGTIKKYGANIIAENILNQVNKDGYHSQMFEGILDQWKEDSAVSMEDKWTTTKCGNHSLHKTTVGWMFRIKWKDDNTEWIPLKLMDKSNPVETAEYAVSWKLDGESVFAWWIPYML